MTNLYYTGTPQGLMSYIDKEVENFNYERMESIKSDYSDEELRHE